MSISIVREYLYFIAIFPIYLNIISTMIALDLLAIKSPRFLDILVFPALVLSISHLAEISLHVIYLLNLGDTLSTLHMPNFVLFFFFISFLLCNAAFFHQSVTQIVNILNILQFYTNIVTPKRMKKCGGAHVQFTLTESMFAGSMVLQFSMIRISFH